MRRHDDGNGRIEESEFHEFMEESVVQTKKRETRSKVREETYFYSSLSGGSLSFMSISLSTANSPVCLS